MNKEEWIKRCEAQFDKIVPNDKANWKDAAEACFDTYAEDFPEDPEDAADEEMSYCGQ